MNRGGAHVALAARREDALLRVRSTLGGGAGSLVAVTDVTDRGQVVALVERVERELGPVEFLVNCAGMMYFTQVSFPKCTTPRAKVPCPTDLRYARGALRAGGSERRSSRIGKVEVSAGRSFRHRAAQG
jgi:NAD(P)-dependent dehydrogenase (short-subunit alcohol dehydrogenase family)